MSNIATMSAKVHALTPEDELIGSLTRERITLLVHEAGNMSVEHDFMAARCWLAYALNCDIPVNAFEQLYYAYRQAEDVKECDLELWWDLANTEANRDMMKRAASMTIDHCVIVLTNSLSTQLGVS